MDDSSKPDDIAYMRTVRGGCEHKETVSHPIEPERVTPAQQRDVTDDETSSDDDGRPILTPLPIYDKPLEKNGKLQSFTDVLDEIMSEDTKCPDVSKIGPKPWLHRRSEPKPKGKYHVSQEPFVFKGKRNPQITQPQRNTPPTKPAGANAYANLKQDDSGTVRRSRPPSRGRASSIARDLADGDGIPSPKNLTDTDNEVAFHSSAAEASISLSNDEVERTESARNAHDLATAALKALSLTKEIVDNERRRTTPQGGSNASASQNSLYDQPKLCGVTDDDEKKNTVISVPTFKPPPDPVRNDKDHPMSSEPIYDASRSSIPTPANVSHGALDLMYQLFGKDLTGDNPFHTQYSRPGSVKSVSFGNEAPGEPRGQRAPSRAGSICSEWSDCTINIPDYPESEATTLPTTTIEFPEMPQVGFEMGPMRQPEPNYPPQPFPNPNMPHFQPNFANPRPYFPTPTYDTPHRYPVPFIPRGMPPPQHPHHNDPGHPTFDPGMNPRRDSYQSNRDTNPWSPPGSIPPHRPQFGAFSPTGHYDPRRHPHLPPMHHAPPAHGYPNHPQHRPSSRSPPFSKNRPDSYSEDETYFSRSPSPVHRRRHRQDYDVIGKSYIDGYKAAMRDAVKTFTENQFKPNLTEKESEEERMHRTLRRTLTSGRMDELPDNVELGDIRKAFSKKFSPIDDDIRDDVTIEDMLLPDNRRSSSRKNSLRQRHRNDDAIPDDVTIDDFVVPHSGRPLSRRNSLRRRHRDDDIIDDDTYEEVHCDSCDCSECEEEMETRRSFHDGELRKRREAKRKDAEERKREAGDDDSKLNQMRQRYMESLEMSGPGRKSYGMNRPPREHPQQWQKFEEVRPFQDRFRNGFQIQNRHPGIQPPNPRSQWERQNRVQFGY